ncbi:MAG TPA: DUF4349 domain-containing protein [Terriglobales bacterium]
MQNKTHPLEQEEVMAYLDGELTGETAAKAAEHLRECRECQALAADLQSVSRQMADWKIDAVESPMTPAITAALEQHEAKFAWDAKLGGSFWRDPFGAFRIPRWALAAGGAALVLVTMVALMTTARYSAGPQYKSMVAAQRQAVETQPMAASSRRLGTAEVSDRDKLLAAQAEVGSNLRLNATTSMAAPPAPSSRADSVHSAVTFNSVAAKPMIARTAQLTLIVKDFDSSQKRLQDILQRHGGFVGEMATSAPEGADRKFSATLRVPANQLDAAIADVKELGRVESESQSGEEVTAQYIDLQARLTNARNTEQRLTELLRRQTGKLDEVVTVEEKISEVREEIERMEAEQKSLNQRVDFGTLSVSFSEEHKSQLQVMPPSVGTQFHNAAVEGYRSVVDGIVSLLIFLMSWGPTLLLWGAVLFFPVRFAWRRLHRAEA